MAIKASACVIMIMKTVFKKHVNHKRNMFLNFFYFRYYKSCLEPLHARYVTNEMTTGGRHRDPIVFLLTNCGLMHTQVVLEPCWITVTNRQKIASQYR